jgi:molybdenum cofactor biosynthesis enzyme MoaA
MSHDRRPVCPLVALDTLWLQVAGTLCNLTCTHCFISCSPTNHAHEMMTLDSLRPVLREAEDLGVRDYYVTGGEPFLNPEILPILEAILKQGPVSVLTNGVLIRPGVAARLRALSDGSPYSLDLRVSLDGFDAARNDAIRGAGVFDRALAGLRCLAEAGLTPIITVTEACEGAATPEGRRRFLDLLAGIGLPRPRLKVMPLLRLGAETARSRAYQDHETTRGMDLPADLAGLACATGRMVTARGVFVCPILLDEPRALMGRTLGETLKPFALRYGGCWTCLEQGLSCLT